MHFGRVLSQEETIDIVRYYLLTLQKFVVHCVTKDYPAMRQFTAKLYSSLHAEDSEERLASSPLSILLPVPRPFDLTTFGVVSIRCEASTVRLIRQFVFVDEELKVVLPQGNFQTSETLAKIHRFG
jgi:hypothetical protein